MSSHKKSAKLVTPDPDLAGWCAALATAAAPDIVPAGWITARELSAKLGKGESTISHQLCLAVRESRAERQQFRIVSGQVLRPVPHYKLK